MVADLNLLGTVGDLYCFSNTLSITLGIRPNASGAATVSPDGKQD